MAYIIKLPPIPTDANYIYSKRRKHDCYYTLPREVECFVERGNAELPIGFYLSSWTLNRAVTLFNADKPIAFLGYEAIILDLVAALDRLHVIVNNYIFSLKSLDK